jgi:signal transduction histidine kinase/CheY-like chemotaxis protein
LLAKVHPEDRGKMSAALLHAADTGEDYRCEVRFLRENRPPRWALVAGRVVERNGSAARIAGVDLDITDRKRAEEALREADRRKDEFLAILSHELRNPLAPIGYAVEFLNRRGDASKELVWARDVIARQLKQVTRLVDDLLDVSRISRGKMELKRVPAELQAIIHDACETSSPILADHGITLHVQLPDEPVHLTADPVRIAQSINNLLTNAGKYTPRGGEVWLSAETRPNEVLISVRDTGFGIPPEMLERIFELFTQVERTIERSQGGLGVGLTLVRSIVTMHGGSVEARSEGVGRGSEFVIRLPHLAPPLPAAVAAAAPATTTTAPHRILVAEDREESADGLRILLETMGHEVHVVHDGEAAVAAAERWQPDLVIMDLGMPRLNGFDAARQIRRQPWGQNLILVALTGWGQEEDQRRSREVGFDHHFTKPVDAAVLESLLSEPPLVR